MGSFLLSTYVLFLVSLALVSLTCGDSTPNVTHEADRCIWKGQCFDSYYVPGGKFNCFYNGKPTKLENGTELFELVNKMCPQYLERGEVCCDVAQMNTMHDQIKTPLQLFARCPACVSNFVNHFCAVTCDPDMSLFMDIPDGSLIQLNDTTWYITLVNVRITKEYTNNLYDSCKSVQYPETGGKVVSYMCGDTRHCNPKQWLKFLGSPIQNGESPFPMNYFFSDSVPGHPEMIPRNASTADFYACNDTRDNITCSCSDCPAVCPPPACRTEQILIAARDSESNFTFQPIDGTTSFWTFGPVFNQDVLTEVLQLQNYLTNMKVPYTDNSGSQRNITLSDICFKPLNNYCMIESVLNYFQNSLENLNYTEQFGLVNSSYHIHYCIRDPIATKSIYYKHKNIPCLAQFGGFIDPKVALAGFQLDLDGEYRLDTPKYLLVTFLVNNHDNEDDNRMVKAWEAAFLDYLDNYKHINTTIEMSFSAERPIVVDMDCASIIKASHHSKPYH